MPGKLFCLYATCLILLYLFVATHTPLNVLAGAQHDDGLYISLGRYLAEGRWLGPFSQFTLMKGPGYPAFLAVNNWLGTPIGFSQALFHCAAVSAFVIVAHRFMRSWLLSALLFTLLLWQPVSLSTPLLRVLRDRVYFDQLLILLAAMAWALFGDGRKGRVVAAFFAGAVLGWFWLTREEGVWILPALGVLAVAASIQAYRRQRFLAIVGTIAIVLAVFAATQIAFRAVNAWTYGTFVGVDFKEANFRRALGALDSVRSGGTKPYVSITHEAMRLVSAVSPAFASLETYFEGPGRSWEQFGCPIYPGSCGEISSGWFMWALRDAAARAGHFSSPAESSAFFGSLADEVEAACARGALRCVPQPIPEMPPLSVQQLTGSLWDHSAETLKLLFLPDHSVDPGASDGSIENLAAALRFLHYPLHTRPAALAREPLPYVISGWYYRAGSEWLSIAVKRADGSVADARVDRKESSDIARHFSDSLASRQRYVVSVECNDECVLELRDADGEMVTKSFAGLNGGQTDFALGKGRVHIDQILAFAGMSYDRTPAEASAQRIRVGIFHAYDDLFLPVLLLGALAFIIVTVTCPGRAFGNPCYVMACVSWLLVLLRAGFLLLVAATSLPALTVHYMAPAYFMLVSGAVFSAAALLQLKGIGPGRARGEA